MSISSLILIFIFFVALLFTIYLYKAKYGGPLDWSPAQISKVFLWAEHTASNACQEEGVPEKIANEFTKYASTFWNYSDFNCISQKPIIQCPAKVTAKINQYLATNNCK